MKQTEHYGLNQWELADRIRMEDFNGDNSKVDAALKSQAEALAAETAAREAADMAEAEARASGDLYVKLLDYTSTSSQHEIDISLASVSLLDYLWLDIHVESAASGSSFYLRVNSVSDDYSYSKVNNTSVSVNYLAYCPSLSAPLQFQARLLPFLANDRLRCIFPQTSNNIFTIGQTTCPLMPSAINTLNLVCEKDTGILPAGTRVLIFGVKR